VSQLVVRRPDHDRGAQYRHRVVVQRSAQGTGRVNVDIGGDERFGGVHESGLGVVGGQPVAGGLGDVGGHHGRAVVDQVRDQVAAHLADAGDADGASAQTRSAPAVFGGGAHSAEDAVRRQHRGVAGAAVVGGSAGDVPALLGDDVHVVHIGADV